MSVEYPPVTLRVEPHAIPAVRAALDATLEELSPHLLRMKMTAYIDEPWLGDPDSRRVQQFYNTRVMDAPDGPMQALLAYETQLVKARDELLAIEAEYRRVEGENSDLWGRA